LLQAITDELAQLLAGRALGRIYQPSGSADLILDFRLRNERLLLISAEPTDPRLHLISTSMKSLGAASRSSSAFAGILRKRIGGGLLLALKKEPLERVIRFVFQTYGAAGEPITFTLIAELLGRSANILLVDQDDRIVWSLKWGKRENLAEVLASRYQPPQAEDKLDPFTISEADFERLLSSGEPISKIVQLRLLGFGPLFAREVQSRAINRSPAAALRSVLEDLFERPLTPVIYSASPLDEILPAQVEPNKNLIVSPIKLEQAAGLQATRFDSILNAVEVYQATLARARAFNQEVRRLKTELKLNLDRRQKLRANLEDDLRRLGDFEKYRKFGELILANLVNLERDGDLLRVVDLYDPAQPVIEIPADSQATPKKVAEGYFKLYQKSRRGTAAITKRLSALEQEIQSISNLLSAAGKALDEEGLNRIRIGECGVPSGSGRRGDKELFQSAIGEPRADKIKRERLKGVRRYLSSDNYQILVGRSGQDNDNLTFKLASANDVWLHAADYPGSHVIIRNPKKQPVPHRSIIEAAELAAFFSQAKNEAEAVVNYTERKYVSKIKGAAPGLVRLASFKSVTVVPQERAIRQD